MLLTKEVEMAWNPRNYKKYIEKGYEFTKWEDIFIINVDDLYKSSNAIVEYSCDYCNEIVPISYANYTKYHKNNEFVKKDCCKDCVHKKQLEIMEVKSELGLLTKNDLGYWKVYKNRLFELEEHLINNTLDDLLDVNYSSIRQAILNYKDNLIDMVLDLNINIYDKCSNLSRFVFYLNESNIKRLIKDFIDQYNYFPSMLEIFEKLQINYVVLTKFGGYHKFKKDFGFDNDNFQQLLNLQYSVEDFQKYSNISGIYKITNIKNGKVYIGKAVDLWHRLTSGYLYRLPYGQCHNKHLQRAWNKDGGENFYIEVVETCDIEQLTEREQYWIDQTQCFKNKFGYNFKDESEENNKKEMSYEARKKMAKLCKDKRGKWNHTQEVKDFLSELKGVSIIQLDLEGNFIKEWKSIKEATQWIGGVESNLGNVLRKTTRTAYGYIWIYKNEYEQNGFNIKEHFKTDRRRSVVQLDLNNNYINTYKSITDAKRATGASNIYVVCTGIQHKSGGFKWMFEEDYLKEVKTIA